MALVLPDNRGNENNLIMTQSIVSILSVISAILFFGAGYLIASFLKKLKLTKVLLEKEQLVESRNTAYRELETYKVHLAEQENKYHSLNGQMLKLQAKNAELKKNEFQAKNQHQELTICIRTLEAKTEKVELLWEENQQLKEENSYLHNKLQPLEQADKERRALAIQMERFKEQASQLEQYRNEVVSLKSAVEKITSLRNKIEKITAENAQLRSLSLVHQPSPQRRAALLEQENLTNALETILVRLPQNKGCREVVLADEQGLLVAGGYSEYSEDLAVIAAMCDDFVKKIPRMLPVSMIQQLNVIDENGITVTAHYFPLVSGLILVSLTVGQGPDRATVEQLSSEISDIMDKAD